MGMDDAALKRIETLIGEYRRFVDACSDVGGDWLHEFGRWLQRDTPGPQGAAHAGLGEEDTLIGMFLVTLNNLTRSRLNTLVNDTPFSNIMDYHYLVVLDSHGRQRKSDLIAINHMEMSSGIEVIRRLLKNGWVEEKPNPEDRRSKYVMISPDGSRLINELQARVDEFYRSFCAGLDERQKPDVLRSLELLVARN